MWYERAIRSLPALAAEYGERGAEPIGLAERADLDRAVDLVGRDVEEALDAGLAGDVAQHVGAVAVRPHEGVRVLDRAVDVRLGGEVDDRVVPRQLGDDGVLVADVGVDEPAAAVVDQVGDVLAVAGVGQGVEDRDRVVGGRRARGARSSSR